MTAVSRAAAPTIGFKRHLRAEVVAGDAVYLFSERKVMALEGASIESVAPLLDGTRDMEALLRDMDDPAMSPIQISRLIGRLAEAGLIAMRYQDRSADDPTCAYWEASGLDAAAAVEGSCAPVSLLTVEAALDRPTAMEALQAAGLTLTHHDGALSIVLCNDYLAPELKEIDAAHRASGRAWLLARPVGERVWIGPVFEPQREDSPCWHCLAHRLWAHRPAEAHVQTVLGRCRPVRRPITTLRALEAAALNLIALEAMKWLAGRRYAAQRCVWTFDSADLDGRLHEVRRRPQCPSCGNPTLMRLQARRPVILTERLKRSQSGGGHRSLTADQIIERYSHLVSPISGVVKEIRRDPRGPDFLNVFQSGPPLGTAARGVKHLRESMRFQNGGKGITPVHAQASALCEALERHCAMYQGDEERIVGSMRSLGERAIHPNACQLYHDRQIADRHHWNAKHSWLQFVTGKIDEGMRLSWTPVWSMTAQTHKLLPTEMLYFGAPHTPGTPMIRADSNGNAAGSSLEDAVLQGLFELIERDAVAIWWYNRTRQPAVDLDAFHEPWLDDLRTGYAELKRELWVLDLTADLGVPVMAAVSRHSQRPRQQITLGFGAHCDPRVALRRALTEMNQVIPCVLDEPSSEVDSADIDAERWWSFATTENQPYLVPDASTRPRKPSDYHYVPCEDLRGDVETIHSRLRDAGLELLVLDQTRPDIELPVVKVIVPGLRHFWARFAPGRLYDVPVQLGRLNAPTAYEDLNPFPIFI
ncbi:TOMM precursor leader peptide-binding protein [Allorhizocola rhizosphaerae]|uniref:TOMM precursor leader peptide-binding protein n=1 Tax=Allorhizocola rhizosphaerae TaxID=1872709 RepID=UPI000E3DD3D1|nr:TOMM precursor leader peptide-binding protein [Allorhizocola rhizosphaerae]